MRDELAGPRRQDCVQRDNGVPAASSAARRSPLRGAVDEEVARVESAAQWLEFHMERFRALWWRDTLLDEDPLIDGLLDRQPSLEDLRRAVALLQEDVTELDGLLSRKLPEDAGTEQPVLPVRRGTSAPVR